MSSKKKSRFSNILLQPRFQLTFVIINWLCMLATAVVCYYLITSTFNDLELIGRKMNLSSNSGYMRFLHSQENMFISRLMLYLPVALSIGFIITVYMSHKVASPIYKIRKYFKNLDWKNPTLLYFRDEDYFSDLAITINKSLKITHRIEKAVLSNPNGRAPTGQKITSQEDVDKLLRETIRNLSALTEERSEKVSERPKSSGKKKNVKRVAIKEKTKTITVPNAKIGQERAQPKSLKPQSLDSSDIKKVANGPSIPPKIPGS